MSVSVNGRGGKVMRKEEGGGRRRRSKNLGIQGWFPPMMTISYSIQNRPLSFD